MIQRVAIIILTGAIALGVIVGTISWFQMPAADRSAVLSVIARGAVWLGIVFVLPWATYFLSTAAARRHSNVAGVLLVAAYTFLDALILGGLFQWSIPSAMAGVWMVLALLIATAYNLLACDWIAERLS